MTRSFKIITVLLFCSYSVAAHYDFNADCRKAYDEILRLNFIEARTILLQEKSKNSKNLVPVYLENYIDFLTLVIGEEKTAFNALKGNKDRRIALLEKGDKTSPYYRYYLAEVYLQWAAARIKFNEYVTAAYEINKAYRLLRRNNEAFPQFIPNHKSLGLLNSLIGSIPDNFKWVVRIIGFNGTIEQGVNQLGIVLRAATQQQEYSHLLTETVFMLAYVNLNLNNDNDKLGLLIDFIEKNEQIQNLAKNSALANYALANIYMRSKTDNDKAITILSSLNPCKQCFSFMYRTYALGMAKLYRHDADAGQYLKSYAENFKGQNYIKEAYQKLAWHYFLQNDTLAYKKYMQKVIIKGNADTDEDKQALNEAESSVLPNYHLLSARLYFDGAYYTKAIAVLTAQNPDIAYKSTKDALEFTYRMGRIYHEMKAVDKAIPFYELTVEKGGDMPYFFAANSCLQMGLIYEAQSDKDKALYYFNKAQNQKNTEYRNSINQKAKAGINRLK